ncbi:hypothetical protein KCM76_16065 [Zooshikella marina]|uniref:hypothetical protein n=1 Tax=Zooshikella ganghwensis TaxID=202772 RepID=UPI001BAEA674|nr:hypothetical protein [Zooshikella ganghwensis]MBU2707510.1 hypothetical protein [Zooshikella ganghwensis]
MISRQRMMAGKTFEDKLNRILVLSPLPIITNNSCMDGQGIIKAKNDVYLDIGHKSVRVGAQNLALLCNLVYLVLGGALLLTVIFTPQLRSGYNFFLNAFLMVFFGLHLFYLHIIARGYFSLKKQRFIRFNRQRRQVALPFGEKGQFIIIPWEKIYAWAGTTLMLSDTTAIPLSTLIITMASPTDVTNFRGRYEVACGAEINCIMQWECIRAFMEEGPDACPSPSKLDTLEEYKDSRRRWKENGILVGWQIYKQKIWDWMHYSYFAYWLSDWHEKRIPKVTLSDEIIRWSEPIPESQWRKPSPELVEANALAMTYYEQGGKLGDENIPVYDPRKKVRRDQIKE